MFNFFKKNTSNEDLEQDSSFDIELVAYALAYELAIADGAIDTAHIADDQVTGDKLANDITIANNLTVAGNLAVTGTTTQTGSVVSDSNFTGLLDENSGVIDF